MSRCIGHSRRRQLSFCGRCRCSFCWCMSRCRCVSWCIGWCGCRRRWRDAFRHNANRILGIEVPSCLMRNIQTEMFNHLLVFNHQIVILRVIVWPPVVALIVILFWPVIINDNQVNLPTRNKVTNLNGIMIDAGDLAVATTDPYALVIDGCVDHLTRSIVCSLALYRSETEIAV